MSLITVRKGSLQSSMQHTDEELYERLRALQKIASPLLTVCLSEDRKRVLWKVKGTGVVRVIDPVEILWT
jgi:hypothetical protein